MRVRLLTPVVRCAPRRRRAWFWANLDTVLDVALLLALSALLGLALATWWLPEAAEPEAGGLATLEVPGHE